MLITMKLLTCWTVSAAVFATSSENLPEFQKNYTKYSCLEKVKIGWKDPCVNAKFRRLEI